MRWLVAMLVVGAGPGAARAEHGDAGVQPWPDPSVPLPTNARLGLLSINGPHPYVTDLATSAPVLVGGGERIALRPVDAFRGRDWDGYGDSGVMLAPATRLAPLTAYTLCFADGACPWSWTTGTDDDRAAPAWRAWPHAQRPSGADYRHAFAVPAVDGGPLVVEVTARAAGGWTQRLWLTAIDAACTDLLLDLPAAIGAVGGGPGHLRRRRVTLTFGGFDVAGNRLPARGRFAVRVDPDENIEVCGLAPRPAPAPPPSEASD